MLRNVANHLKILFRYWQFTLINIIGLSLGIAASVLIFNHCYNELNYDEFHKKSDRTFLLGVDAKFGNFRLDHLTQMPLGIAPAIANEYSFIQSATRISYNPNLAKPYIIKNNKLYNVKNWIATDSTFFDIFTIPVLKGNPKTLLSKPKTAVLTKSAAQRIFGTLDIIGEKIQTPCGLNLTIIGVVDDYPNNSHFDFEVLFSLSSYGEPGSKSKWTYYSVYTYLLLNSEESKDSLKREFPGFFEKYMEPHLTYSIKDNNASYYHYFLTNLEDIYLSGFFGGSSGNKRAMIYILLSLALIIILIACFNYVNLSIAVSDKRRREIAIRKIAGAGKNKLASLYLLESVMLAFIALLVGMLIVEYTIPLLNEILEEQYTIDYLNHPLILPGLLLYTLLIGLLSGLYPALVISSYDPIQILNTKKNQISFLPIRSVNLSRTILVISQITACIIIFIATLTIQRQLKYMQKKNVHNKLENVVVLTFSEMLEGKHNKFRKALLSNKNIQSVSYTNSPPGMGFNKSRHFLRNDLDESGNWSALMLGSYDIAETIGLNVIKGQGFVRPKNRNVNKIMVNQTFVDNLNLENPINKMVYGTSWGGRRDCTAYEIVGVFRNFHYQSLRSPINNLVIYPIEGLDDLKNFTLIRLKPGSIFKTLPFIENQWDKYSNHFPFRYSLLKNDLNNLYQKEKETLELFRIFSILALIIACLGLYGLSVFVLNRREKEMGVRKSLGAPMKNIILKLVRHFAGWIFVANFLAIPIAYFLLKEWLSGFAFHIQPNWFDFMISFVIILSLMMGVTLVQVIKIARVNPADALKDE